MLNIAIKHRQEIIDPIIESLTTNDLMVIVLRLKGSKRQLGMTIRAHGATVHELGRCEGAGY